MNKGNRPRYAIWYQRYSLENFITQTHSILTNGKSLCLTGILFNCIFSKVIQWIQWNIWLLNFITHQNLESASFSTIYSEAYSAWQPRGETRSSSNKWHLTILAFNLLFCSHNGNMSWASFFHWTYQYSCTICTPVLKADRWREINSHKQWTSVWDLAGSKR